MHISRQIIKPNDCLLAISMPLSKKCRNRNLSLSSNAEFSRKIFWELYKNDTLLPFKYLVPLAKKLKVSIKAEFTLSDLKFYLSSSKFKAIIIIAHWNGESIELFDTFCTPRQFLDFLPEDRKVIIDLNICNCKSLADTVAPMRENALFKRAAEDGPSYPGAWFLFYKGFFKLISDKNLTYLEAINLNSHYYKNLIYAN